MYQCILLWFSGGAKDKEEIDDQPPVLEENFPTLKQASMMAKGIKLDHSEKKDKQVKQSKTDETGTYCVNCFYTPVRDRLHYGIQMSVHLSDSLSIYCF